MSLPPFLVRNLLYILMVIGNNTVKMILKGIAIKRETAFVMTIAVTVLCCAGYSSATVLGTIEYGRAGSDLGEFSEMNFSICYPLPLPAEPGPVNMGWDWSISLSWNVTPDDVGKTFLASADTNQSFDIFIFLLTNGINNSLILTDSTVSKFPIYAESALISGIQDGVDFEGYTIDNIALTINELFLDYDGFLASYSYDITYTINGAETIPNPEPATILLLGLGGITLLRRRERCSRMLI